MIFRSFVRIGSLRYGLYSPIKDAIGFRGVEKRDIPLWGKVIAGSLSGTFSSIIANPTDLIKVSIFKVLRVTWLCFFFVSSLLLSSS